MAGTFTWDMPGCDVAIQRQVIYGGVKVFTADSETEVRVAWSTTPRYRYRFTITGRTTVSGDEVATLQTFYNDQYGLLDSFSMSDPYGAGSVTCRFDGPMQMQRVTPTWWRCTFDVVTVVNAT